MLRQSHTEYSGYRTTGVRLTEPTLPDIVSHSSEGDLPLLSGAHMFDKAHLIMLAEEDLIPRQEAVAMLKALRDMEAEGMEKVRLEVDGGIHSGEQYLIRGLGEEVGGRIHLGRSSGDLGAVSRRVRQRESLIELMDLINEARLVLLQAGEENLDAVMPGHTHTQHAQPLTLGFHFLSWASVLERDYQRADSTYQRVNQSPAGSAILTGSNFALNRHRTADLLGFDGVIENTHDAILNLDVALDSMVAAAMVGLNLARWASDLNFWFTSEARYIDIPDRFCGTSSIMMQKKNPYALEHLRASSAECMGSLMTGFAVLKAGSGEVNTDRQYLYEALWRSFDLSLRNLRWFAQLIPGVEPNRDHMREMAGSYWAQATDVAGALVSERDMPWRTAHQIVGILVRFSYERGIKPSEVTPELVDEAAMAYNGQPVGMSATALQKALDPAEFVNGRTLFGGPAPEECRLRLVDFRTRLREDQASVQEKQRRLEEAAARMEHAIDALLKQG